MRAITGFALAALLVTAAACTGGLTYQEPALSNPLVLCSPLDPQCTVMQPFDERSQPRTQQ